MYHDGLKRGRSEIDKPPISEAQKDWAQEHGPSPFHLPENQAQPWPAFLQALTPGIFGPGCCACGTTNITVAVVS